MSYSNSIATARNLLENAVADRNLRVIQAISDDGRNVLLFVDREGLLIGLRTDAFDPKSEMSIDDGSYQTLFDPNAYPYWALIESIDSIKTTKAIDRLLAGSDFSYSVGYRLCDRDSSGFIPVTREQYYSIVVCGHYSDVVLKLIHWMTNNGGFSYYSIRPQMTLDSRCLPK